MQRNCKSHAPQLISKLINFVTKPTSAQRNISFAYVDSVFIAYHFDKFDNIIIIVKWFATAHKHNIGYFSLATTQIVVYCKNFPHHFTSCKISYQSIKTRGTKCAIHTATNLRAYANCIAILI